MKNNISDSRSIEGVKVLFSANIFDVEYGEGLLHQRLSRMFDGVV